MKKLIFIMACMVFACGGGGKYGLSPKSACATDIFFYDTPYGAEQINKLECDGTYRVILTQPMLDVKAGDRIEADATLHARNDTGVNVMYSCGMSFSANPNDANVNYQMKRPAAFNITPDAHKGIQIVLGAITVDQGMIDAGAKYVNAWCRAAGTKTVKGDYLEIKDTMSTMRSRVYRNYK